MVAVTKLILSITFFVVAKSYSFSPALKVRNSPSGIAHGSSPHHISAANKDVGTEAQSSVNLSGKQINEKEVWFSRGALLLVSAFYGTNFGCVKILGEALDPSVAAALRFSLAACVFFPQMTKRLSSNPKLVVGGLEVGAYCALGYWAQAKSLLTSDASTAAFICSLAVIVVPILEMMFGRENAKSENRLAPLFPALLAAAGVGCLELGGATLPGVGDAWALLQPLFFGLSFFRVERHMAEATAEGDSQAFTGAMMLMIASFALVWSAHDFLGPHMGSSSAVMAAVQSQAHAFSDWHVGAAVVWTGIVTTALTVFVENQAMKRLTASESTVIYSTEPLWGTAFAAMALGEHVGWNTAAGAVLIVLACLWSSMGSSTIAFAGLFSAIHATSEQWLEEFGGNINANVLSLLERWREVIDNPAS